IFKAIAVRNKKMFNLLVEYDADLDVIDRNGYSLLKWAAKWGDYDAALYLSSNGHIHNSIIELIEEAKRNKRHKIVNLLETYSIWSLISASKADEESAFFSDLNSDCTDTIGRLLIQ